jgi:hypothetical protein
MNPIVSAYDRGDDFVGLPQAPRWLVMPARFAYFWVTGGRQDLAL